MRYEDSYESALPDHAREKHFPIVTDLASLWGSDQSTREVEIRK